MAQGKLKVKAKLPSNVKRKSNRRQLNNVRKGKLTLIILYSDN